MVLNEFFFTKLRSKLYFLSFFEVFQLFFTCTIHKSLVCDPVILTRFVHIPER
jgi:hypothetical protein